MGTLLGNLASHPTLQEAVLHLQACMMVRVQGFRVPRVMTWIPHVPRMLLYTGFQTGHIHILDSRGLGCRIMGLWAVASPFVCTSFAFSHNRFPRKINDVPPPIINNPGTQKLFIIRRAYLLREFGRSAFKFLFKQIEIEFKFLLKSSEIELQFLLKSIEIELQSR